MIGGLTQTREVETRTVGLCDTVGESALTFKLNANSTSVCPGSMAMTTQQLVSCQINDVNLSVIDAPNMDFLSAPDTSDHKLSLFRQSFDDCCRLLTVLSSFLPAEK